MAFTENFSTTESLSSPNIITFNDTSTGTDNTLTVRRIYIKLANGNWLTTSGESTTEAYETWPYANASITLDLLNRSTTANVTVNWYANVNNPPAYTKTILQEWDLYDYLFLYNLLSSQTSFPAVNSNSGYWPNSFKMITNLFESEQAVIKMDDLYSSQSALDRNQVFINNENYFF